MKAIIVFLAVLSVYQMSAQNFAWQWAASLPTDEGMNDAMVWNDASGNVYASASYYGSELTVGTYTLQNSTPFTENIALVKYDSEGAILWAKGFGSAGTDRFTSAVCDSEGNTILSGTTNSASLELDGFVVVPVGGFDSFIAKLDPEGNVLWVESFGGASNDFLRPLKLDANDNIYVTGYFYSPTLILDDFSIPNTGSPDMFLAKLDDGGTAQWAFGLTGDVFSSEIPTSIAVSAAGQCLISGTFSTDIGIGPFSLSPAGNSDAFLSLVSTEGSVQWAQALQSASYENIIDVEFVNEERFFCAGWFEGAEFMIGNQTLLNEGTEGSDVFLASFQINGTPDWAISAGGVDNDNSPYITMADNTCFLAMGFESPTLAIGDYVFINSGDEDVCFAQIDITGEVLWAGTIGGVSDEFCNSISTDNNGNVYVGGSFRSDQLNFGNHELLNESEFGNHVFLAKLAEIPARVPELLNQEAVTLFPNPCIDVLNITFSTRIDSPAHGEVFSRDGRLVHSFQCGKSGSSFVFDTSHLAPGLYTLSIRNTDGAESRQRFLIAR